jgi:hypothetical protein
MNWEAISGVAEIVGATAVVVSLIYLARQIKLNSNLVLQNSKHIEATIYHSTNEAFLNWHALIAQDEEVASIWARFYSNAPVEAEDKIRAHALLTILFLCFESNYQQERLGVISRRTLEHPAFRGILERKAVAKWWEKEGPRVFTREFQEAVAEIQKQSELKAGSSDTAKNSPNIQLESDA